MGNELTTRSRRHAHRALMLAALVATSFSSRAQAQAPGGAIDVTGKWQFTVTSSAGTGTPTITFKQHGDSLTGHYSSATLGEADFTGSVKADKIAFNVTVEVQGTTLVVSYKGDIESRDSMKGSVVLGELGSGTFTAKKQ
jgi:hypothetical protein